MKKIFLIIILSFLVGILLYPETKILTAAPSLNPTQIGKASWYSRQSPGINRHTANNEIFNDQDMTCAIWGVSFNRLVRVTNLANERSIIVRVNDRGPHRRYAKKGRLIDLTREAFSRLGAPHDGLMDVVIEFL